MKLGFVPHFQERVQDFPAEVRKKFYKQVGHLLHNIRYPSLHAKKYDEQNDIWQARVDDHIRFYFMMEGDTYVLLTIRTHP